VKPQCEAVLELLREQGEAGVTPALAFAEVGTMRLAARVYEIAEQLDEHHEIVNVGWTTASGKHVARYVLRRRELWLGLA
jgi:hypothetical protein